MRRVFDQHDVRDNVPHITRTYATVRSGRLRDDFDVVFVPHMSLREARDGISVTAVPDAFAGGLGGAGLAELARFVSDGGTPLLLDHAADVTKRRDRVIMFGVRPQYRGQLVGPFKLLVHALLTGGTPGAR